MTEHIPNYSEYFHINQRIKVELPLGSNQFFHEWAVISSISKNLFAICLSRDMLPHNLQLKSGEPLSIRAGSRGQGYRCKAVIEHDDSCENLTIKLTGPVISDELRSYFRLDTSISLEYSPETPEQSWEAPRNRCITGHNTTEYGDISVSMAYPLTFQNPFVMEHNRMGENVVGKVPATEPLIINISGGGIRAELQEELQAGTRLNLAFHLPHPQPELVPAVAEVVYCQPSAWRSNFRYIAGMRYIRIHERNRDRIIKYVCSEEIKKIRNCNKDFHSLPIR